LAAVIWLALACAPLAGLAKLALASEPAPTGHQAFPGLGIAQFIHRISEEDAPGLLANSLLLGLSVAVAWFLAAWWIPRASAGIQARRFRARIALLCQCVPPVVSGVGVLALLRLIDLSAAFVRTGSGGSESGVLLDTLSILLDPYGSPPFLLLLGTCLAYLPSRVAARDEQLVETEESARGVDQALVAGTRGNRARRLVFHAASARTARRIVLWATLAVTSIAPAILLAPTIDRCPVGPGIVLLASHSHHSPGRAAALAVIAIAANWAALALARAGWDDGRDRQLEVSDLA
jgi:hypothetical protein